MAHRIRIVSRTRWDRHHLKEMGGQRLPDGTYRPTWGCDDCLREFGYTDLFSSDEKPTHPPRRFY